MHEHRTPIALLALGSALSTACVSAARTNARLEPGWDVTVVASDAATLATPDDPEVVHMPAPEIHVQRASVDDRGAGAAVQLKVPAALLYSSIDLYATGPHLGRHALGIGLELGYRSALYGVYTVHFDQRTYATLTPRLLAAVGDGELRDRLAPFITLNGQLAIGRTGEHVDLSAFAGYFRVVGDEMYIGQGGCDLHCYYDHRSEFLLVGTSARF